MLNNLSTLDNKQKKIGMIAGKAPNITYQNISSSAALRDIYFLAKAQSRKEFIIKKAPISQSFCI
jgi:hypothetical protein